MEGFIDQFIERALPDCVVGLIGSLPVATFPGFFLVELHFCLRFFV